MTSAALQHVIDTGSGKLGARLQIAGMPYECVTHKSMEKTTSDGRQRLSGLSLQGISYGDSVDMARATVQASGFTARIGDVAKSAETNFAAWTYLFSKRPTNRTWTTATITDGGLSLAVLSTSGFASSGRLWIDQECMLYDSITGTVFTVDAAGRSYWTTLATYHYALDTTGTSATRAVEVTDWPQTAEGRHARLYYYAEGDDPQGDGTLRWTGIVSRDAKLTDDAASWEIGIDPITTLLNQDLGGDLAQPMNASGIYYSWACGLSVSVYISSDATFGNLSLTPVATFIVTGHFVDDADLCNQATNGINALLTTNAASVVAAGLSAVPIAGGGFQFELNTPAASAKWVAVIAFSPVDLMHTGGTTYSPGGASGFPSPIPGVSVTASAWLGTDGVTPLSGTSVSTSARYIAGRLSQGGNAIASGLLSGTTVINAVASPGTIPRGCLLIGDVGGGGTSFPASLRPYITPSVGSTLIGNRLYLGGSTSIGGITAVTIDTGSPPAAVSAVTPNVAGRYVDLTSAMGAVALLFAGPASPPTVTPTRTYVAAGTLHDLLLALPTTSAVGATVGTAPYIEAFDFAEASSGSTPILQAATAAGTLVSRRNYSTSKPLKLQEFLAEEAKNLGVFMAVNNLGQIAFYQVGSSPSGATRIITDASIISALQVPGWERNALGSIGDIIVSTLYDPSGDKFMGPTLNFDEISAKGRNPNSQTVTIQPKSTLPMFVYAGGAVYGFFTGFPAADLARMVAGYNTVCSAVLAFFGYPYDVITLTVSLKQWDAVCGDNVSITSSWLPNGSGGRGITNRVGVIIGRRWEPATGTGTLTCLCTEINYAGYTPTSRISSQADNGGNLWTLTIAAPAAGATRAYSPAANTTPGDVWALGDDVQVMTIDVNTDPVLAHGSVKDVTLTTVQVQFTGLFTPAGTMNLEYGSSNSWQATQQIYEAMASSGGQITYSGGSVPARQFAP